MLVGQYGEQGVGFCMFVGDYCVGQLCVEQQVFDVGVCGDGLYDVGYVCVSLFLCWYCCDCGLSGGDQFGYYLVEYVVDEFVFVGEVFVEVVY